MTIIYDSFMAKTVCVHGMINNGTLPGADVAEITESPHKSILVFTHSYQIYSYNKYP